MTPTSARPRPASTAAPRSPARRNTPPSSTSPGLAYGSVVASTIAKGRIARHRHQRGAARRRRARRAHPREPPAHGGQRQGLQGRRGARAARRSGRSTTTRSCSTASRSRWSSPRTGRSRASRRRWCGSNTRRKPHVTDLHAPARRRPSSIARSSAAKPRGDAEQAFAAADVRHEAEYFVPIEHHNPMELFASTVIVGRRRQAHGLRQDPGRAERAALSLRRVRDEAGGRARHVALHGRRLRLGPAPAVPGGAGGAGGARAGALGAPRADARSRCTRSAIGRRRSSGSRSAPTPTARSMRSRTMRSR